MGGVKAVKALKNAYQKYTGVAFFLGFFLVILTYFTFSDQLTIRAPNAVLHSSPSYESQQSSPTEDNKILPKSDERKKEDIPEKKEINVGPTVSDSIPSTTQQEDKKEEEKTEVNDFKQFENMNQALLNKPICDTENPQSDTCDIYGDVRTHGLSLSILLNPQNPIQNRETHEWKVSPYSRRHMKIPPVTIKELKSPQEAPPCTVKSNVPAVVFALGGLTGNYWHDHTDVLIPLFLASRKFNGEVQFLITNMQGWFLGKYHKVLQKLSNHEIIDFDKDQQVRCYPYVHVGIRILKEFSIIPSLSPEGYSMVDFTKFMRSVHGLQRDSPINMRESPGKKPRLMIISRRHPRKIVNLQEIVQLAENIGFEVVIGDPPFNVNVGEFAKEINSVDALMGVHGAGLTNSIYLPTNAVFIQIVPYGNLDHLCRVDFGDPAIDMKLKYLKYDVSVEESTLLEMLGKDHPAVKDPAAIQAKGWDQVAEFYLGKQDVKLDVNRFAPTLVKALERLRE
ncbi:hypothetical protein LUZ60_009846 [Juncus effusus]|nr:hypothetical protein LUZ60_009846 [Juncus effusus]